MSKLFEQIDNIYGEESINGVQFGIFSPDDIRNGSACEILVPDTYDGTEPKANGLFDPRMGVIDEGRRCLTCEQKSDLCPGHFGHIELPLPCFNIEFLDKVIKILRCVCFRCSNLLVNKSDAQVLAEIGKKSGKNRFDTIYNMMNSSQKQKRCKYNDGCFIIQPKSYKLEKFDKSASADKTSIIKIYAEFSQEALKDPKITNTKQLITAEICMDIFKKITDDDCEFIGLSSKYSRPDWMLWTAFPIPPPAVRPSVRKDNNQRSEDDLTHILFNIVKDSRMLKQKIETDAPKAIIDANHALLQYRIVSYINNEIPSIPHMTHRSGRPLKTLNQRLKGKEGRMRWNLMGKRVDYSGRTVISVDTNISIDEYGVPEPIMMNLTYPEIVTKYNKNSLLKLVQNGPDVYPGAKTIQINRYDTNGNPISSIEALKYIQDRNKIVLNEGDVVNRHLQNNDIGLSNRQPSLHRMSMMAMKLRKLKGNTFKLNVSVTKPFNADFDGDEMNLHVPQSIMTKVELEELAMVPKQIIGPGNCKPVIQIVQDSLSGSFLLTQENVRVNKSKLYNLMMENKDYNGKYIEPIDKDNELWSGFQVFSLILPEISLEMNNNISEKVVIEGGKYIKGALDNGVLGARGISQNIYNIFGIARCHRFLDTTQLLITRWLEQNSFSIGIDDCQLPDPNSKTEITKIITKGVNDVEKIITEAQQGLYFPNLDDDFRKKQLEAHITTILGEASANVYKYINSKINQLNGFNVTVKSGSKGSSVNIRQVMGCLGQQDIWGSRVENGYNDRTLPHFSKYDLGVQSHGFIKHSFSDGLTADEFFFHMMTGRTGLIDTAVRTADSGYTNRRLEKAAEDAQILYDLTVRNANNNIIQLKYGDDGYDPTLLEKQDLLLIQWSNIEMEKRYKFQFESTIEWSMITLAHKDLIANKNYQNIIENEYTTLINLRDILRNKYYYNLDVISGINIFLPFNLPRYIQFVKSKFNVKEYDISNLNPIYVINSVNNLCSFINTYSKETVNNELTKISIRTYLASKQCIIFNKLNILAFDYIINTVKDKIMRSYIQPGELVGPLCAQSLGEPLTQMTLNTFHLSGDASKSVVVTAGVPRFKEIVNVSKNIKTPSMNIYLKPEYSSSKEIAENIKNSLEFTKMQDIIIQTEIIHDDFDNDNLPINHTEDAEFIDIYRQFNEIICADIHSGLSKWGLRLELNKEIMMNKNISMSDVQEIILNRFNSDEKIQCIISDDNSNNLVMRIKIHHDEDHDFFVVMNELEKQINNIILKGIPEIKKVGLEEKNIIKYNPDGSYYSAKEWILNTYGSNLLAVFSNDYIDSNRTTTNDIIEIYQLFGIEAARQKIIDELGIVFSGNDINFRHIALIADIMTYRGVIMQIDRHGVNRSNDYSPISKASFEEIDDILVNSSIFGDYDKMTSVSANIMFGQIAPAGTGLFNILIDEDKILNRKSDGKTEVVQSEHSAENINQHIDKVYETTDTVNDDDFEFKYNIKNVQEHMLSEIIIKDEPVKIIESSANTAPKMKIKIAKKK